MHELHKLPQLDEYTLEELKAWADAQLDKLLFEDLSGPYIPCLSPYRTVGARQIHTNSGIERFKVDMEEYGCAQ